MLVVLAESLRFYTATLRQSTDGEKNWLVIQDGELCWCERLLCLGNEQSFSMAIIEIEGDVDSLPFWKPNVVI